MRLTSIAMLAVLAVLAVATAGCFHATTSECGDGTSCPTTTVCAPSGGGCVDPAQISACVGLGDDANCTTSAIEFGVCTSSVCTATQWTATVVIGGQLGGTTTGLSSPNGVALDLQGDLYIADMMNNRVLRLDVSGALTTVAGDGTVGSAGDLGLATSAQLSSPSGVAVDGLGNVYISDRDNNKVRRVDTNGIITTVAGNGVSGSGGDDGPAIEASLKQPGGVAVDGLDNVFIADTDNNRIRKVDVAGVITTIAGTGTAGPTGNGVPATTAELDGPEGIALDDHGNLFIADTVNNLVREIDSSGTITTIAGGGSGGDGGAATAAKLITPTGVAVDAAGQVYIADRGNTRIRRIATSGTITTVAGSTQGFSGDGGPATQAKLRSADDVAVDASGQLYIVDGENERVRFVDTNGTITTIVGDSLAGGVSGDGGAATSGTLGGAAGCAFDGSGNLFIVETKNSRIRRVDTAGVITTVAGDGSVSGGTPNDGIPASAAYMSPAAVAIDSTGGILIADFDDHSVRRVDGSGMITTVVGTGSGYSGDGGPAVAAKMSAPNGLAMDGHGNYYISDANAHCVRRVDSSGIITTVAGDGTSGGGGDGGAATAAQLGEPAGIAVDAAGNLYIADTVYNRVRVVDPSGRISAFAGTGLSGSGGDGGPATLATFNVPTDVAVDAAGDVFIADSGSSRVRKVHLGSITTVAGTTSGGAVDGDGGLATAAVLSQPTGLAFDASGALFIAGDTRVRRVDAAGIITTVAGNVDPEGMGPFAQGRLADPRALAVGSGFTLVAGGSSGTVQLVRDSTSSVGVVAGRYPQATAAGALARFRTNTFGEVRGVAYDAAANVIYLSESSANRIQAVTLTNPDDPTTWTIAPLVGADGSAGFANGPAANAQLRDPGGLYFDATAHILYVADSGNHVIRAIDLSAGAGAATVSTIAGTPDMLGVHDGVAATSALLDGPQAFTQCANGDQFIADTLNGRVRRIAASTHSISTVLGDGSLSSSGEGHPASSFPVDQPLELACDPTGNLFVTSTATVRMLLADDNGVVDGTGAVRTIYGVSPRTDFPATVTRCLSGLAAVDATTVRVADSCTGLLVELKRQ